MYKLDATETLSEARAAGGCPPWGAAAASAAACAAAAACVAIAPAPPSHDAASARCLPLCPTLSSPLFPAQIAKAYKIGLEELIAANTQLENPDQVLEGQVIYVPCDPETRGDNLLDLLEHRNEVRQGRGKVNP